MLTVHNRTGDAQPAGTAPPIHIWKGTGMRFRKLGTTLVLVTVLGGSSLAVAGPATADQTAPAGSVSHSQAFSGAEDVQPLAWERFASFPYGSGSVSKLAAAVACLDAGRNGVARGWWTDDHWHCTDVDGRYFALMVWR
ncbi:hypothetical protein AB0L99_26860 [Streptomyces sp. NPDC051954]|uniref:hypothetical protein n=1 Tax=unclassified Streptomyces TaxID=2593676 RepID=UPI00342A2876